MIAFIQGELCEVGQDTIIVACQGIGYEIQVPVSVAQSLPDPGSRVKIYTYTYVREDALGLFGFLTRDDLTVFKLLITVNGVGPKAALAILSSMSCGLQFWLKMPRLFPKRRVSVRRQLSV